MLKSLKKLRAVKRLRRSAAYVRLRQYFPAPAANAVTDDRAYLDHADIVTIEWPGEVPRPRVGIVQDYGPYPRWTKYCRFLNNNSFEHAIYDIHAHDWIQRAVDFDLVVGFVSSVPYDLQEMHRKYEVLEAFLGKTTYPTPAQARLYEDKCLEAYIAEILAAPFARTYVSYSREDALRLAATMPYPVISKVVPSSASVGVEMVRTAKRAREIVEQAFSANGRKTHLVYQRQKNYVYFQEYVPNDGYDVRVMVIGNRAFGYYRKALAGDFRASGMDQVEKRALPVEAMRIALRLNQLLQSPQLIVDMVHGMDDRYYIVEFSPVCQMETPEQLHVDGVPGVYVFDAQGSFRFEPGRYWLPELALKEFLQTCYLPKMRSADFAVRVRPERTESILDLRHPDGRPITASADLSASARPVRGIG